MSRPQYTAADYPFLDADKAGPQELFDFDAEEAVIGCLCLDLGDHDTADIVFAEMAAEDMGRDKNRWAFVAAEALHKAGTPLDPLTVGAEMARRYPNKAEPAWDSHFRTYLQHCQSIVPTTVHARYYARLVHVLGCKRRREKVQPPAWSNYRGLAL